MAKLLKPYGASSTDVKIDGVNRKGYRRDHLHDPWTRYLPPAHGVALPPLPGLPSRPERGRRKRVAGSKRYPLPQTCP